MANDVIVTAVSRRPNPFSMCGWTMATLVPLATMVPGESAHAQVTVPYGNITPCNAKTVAANMAAGTIAAVPGQPGEMGFQTGQTLTDVNGNTIAVYCLLANKKHGGPDQAALFTPAGKGKQSVWVGACTLGTGQNVFSIMVDQIHRAPDGQSFLGAFTGFKWENYENITPADSKALMAPGATKTDATYKDYDYTYNIAKDTLSINQTTGYYQNTKFGRGDAVTYLNKTSTPNPKGAIMAPATFQGLTYNGQQLAALGTSGDPGLARQSLTLTTLVTHPPGGQTFELLSDALYGTGSAIDPFVGLSVPITAGDTLTVGEGATSALVTGSAALSSYGAWTLESMSSYSTTFEATSDAVLVPGDVIDGFDLVPVGNEQTIPWIYAGSDPYANSAGYVVPEPGAFGILASALGLLAMSRRYRPRDGMPHSSGGSVTA
jgi:hypothetical protein